MTLALRSLNSMGMHKRENQFYLLEYTYWRIHVSTFTRQVDEDDEEKPRDKLYWPIISFNVE